MRPRKCLRNLNGRGFEITACNSTEEAVEGADIITTATADKQYATIVTDNMVGSGVHINAVGGDCPGKTELQRAVLLRSGIFVEHAPQTRVEGEIQQLPADHPVTELWEVDQRPPWRAQRPRTRSPCSIRSDSPSRISPHCAS